MLRRLLIVGVVAALAMIAVAPVAGASVDRFEVPITGDRFVCDGTEYTVTSGSVKVKVREGAAAQGNSHLTVSIRPRGLLVDPAGNEFKLLGAESVHVSSNANSGGMVVHEVFHVAIVSTTGGGVVGGVAEIFHLTVNPNNVNEFAVSLGSCEGPIPA